VRVGGVESKLGWIAFLVVGLTLVPLVTAAGDARDPCTPRGNAPDPVPGRTCDPGWPSLDQAVIRPGLTLNVTGVLDFRPCTADFVFSSLDNRTLYIGTVSHCVQGRKVGDQVTLANITDAGVLVYCSFQHVFQFEDCGPALPPPIDHDTDFALIQIHRENRALVHPAVHYWGGPTRLGAPPPAGTPLLAYSNPQFSSAYAPMRGVALDSSEKETSAAWAHTLIPGDSGSPALRADGQAVGALDREDFASKPPRLTIQNLGAALAYMKQASGLDVELKTWPLLEHGPLP
jgi:hypothetical protein